MLWTAVLASSRCCRSGARGDGLEAEFAAGTVAPPRLADIEAALEPWAGTAAAVVQVDPWDLERLGSCGACAGERRRRLERISLSGRGEARFDCAECGGAS